MIVRPAILVLVFSAGLSIDAHFASAQTPPLAAPSSDATPSTAPSNGTTDLDQSFNLLTANNTPEARRLGARLLLESGKDEAIDRLIGVLSANPPDLAAQLAVVEAIAEVEKPSPPRVEPLIAMLGNLRPDTLEGVTRAIRRFDSGIVVERLRPLAVDASIPRPKRIGAIRALGVLGEDVKALGVLAGLLEEPNPAIRHAALMAFGEATGVSARDTNEALAWWKQTSLKTGDRWYRALIESRAQQVSRLIRERTDLTRRLVNAYRDAYLATAEADRPRLILSLLNDELASVRMLGLDLVNDLITDRKEISPDARARIVELTIDADPRVRLKATRIVGDLRLSAAVAKLIEAMQREIDDEVRAAQASALGRLDDPVALGPLLERLDGDSPLVVGEAVTALGVLLRRGQTTTLSVDPALQKILDRYSKLGPDDVELRERFLNAMTSIGAKSFRETLESEVTGNRPVRVRSAAIAGLATCEDARAAEVIRPLTQVTLPDIRMAAVSALGICGSDERDLEALRVRLDTDREDDAAIRLEAWDSYLMIARRLPTNDQIRISDQLDLPDDPTAQRHRLDLLKAVRGDPTRFDTMAVAMKTDVLERMADAQVELKEYPAASASLEHAMRLLGTEQNGRYAELAARSLSALLMGREDAAAAQRLGELFDGQQINGELSNVAAVSEMLLDEVGSRLAAASDGASYEAAFGLINTLGAFAGKAGESFADELNKLRDDLAAKRDRQVDALLATLTKDPEAETKLFQLGKQAVLPKVYERLKQNPPNDESADDVESRLVQLAKRFVPTWPGLENGGTPSDRAEALRRLKDSIDTTKSDA